jgi:hypothetical protein
VAVAMRRKRQVGFIDIDFNADAAADNCAFECTPADEG